MKRGVFVFMKNCKLPILAMVLLLIQTSTLLGDGKLQKIYEVHGTYGVAVQGVGMQNNPSGTMNLWFQGTVEKAFLYWAGFDLTGGGDNQVALSVDGGVAHPVVAEQSYGPDLWWEDVPTFHYAYRAEVTSLVQPDFHTYLVSDFAPIRYRYGAALVVIYKYNVGPNQHIQILDGLDAAYALYDPPRGPNSEVTSVYLGNNSYHKYLRYVLLVGGVKENRPNAIWVQPTAVSEPANLINEPGAVGITEPHWPLGDKNGEEWDVFDAHYIFPPMQQRFNVQIESKNDVPGLLGASFLWIGLISELSDDYVVPVELADYQAEWTAGGVNLAWTTRSETNNLGFFVFRAEEESGPYLQLNNEPLAAAGNSEMEHHYTYLDRNVGGNKIYYYKMADIDFCGRQTLHGPVTVKTGVISDFMLQQNYPNPFNPITTIEFTLPQNEKVRISVADISGREMALIHEGPLSAGRHKFIFSGQGLASGLYFYHVDTPTFHECKTMILLK